MVTFNTLHLPDHDLDIFRQWVTSYETDEEFRLWFSDSKFCKMDFVNVEGCFVEGQVISVSGCSLLEIDGNDWLRVGQLHYTIPGYRTQYRDSLIREGGFLDRHADTARGLGLDRMLISVHVFNHKTTQIDQIFKFKRRGYRWLRDLNYIGQYQLRNKQQHCYGVEL